MKLASSYLLAAKQLSPRHRLLRWALGERDIQVLNDCWATGLICTTTDPEDHQWDPLAMLREDVYRSQLEPFLNRWLTDYPDRAWIQDEHGWDLLDWAMVRGLDKVVDRLLDHPARPPLAVLAQRSLPVEGLTQNVWIHGLVAKSGRLAEAWERVGGTWSPDAWEDVCPSQAGYLVAHSVVPPEGILEVWKRRVQLNTLSPNEFNVLAQHLKVGEVDRDTALENFVRGFSTQYFNRSPAFKLIKNPATALVKHRGPSGQIEALSLLGVCVLDLIRQSGKNTNLGIEMSSFLYEHIADLMGPSPRPDLFPGFSPEPLLAWLAWGKALFIQHSAEQVMGEDLQSVGPWLVEGAQALKNLAATRFGQTKPFKKVMDGILSRGFGRYMDDIHVSGAIHGDLDRMFRHAFADAALAPSLTSDSSSFYQYQGTNDRGLDVYRWQPAFEAWLDRQPERCTLLLHLWSRLGATDSSFQILGLEKLKTWLEQEKGLTSQEWENLGHWPGLGHAALAPAVALIREHRLHALSSEPLAIPAYRRPRIRG